MRDFKDLIKLFFNYKIYPISRYTTDVKIHNAKAFMELFPENYYSRDIRNLISEQKYKPVRSGADLPWWGEKYFSDENQSERNLIVAQDSNHEDAGGIVFMAALFPNEFNIENDLSFKNLEKKLKNKGVKKIWRPIKKMKKILRDDMKVNLDYAYITDAHKVYKKSIKKKKDFDLLESSELLRAEIEICKPDRIILLGKSALSCLFRGQVEIKINDVNCIISPFPVGQGKTHYKEFIKNYKF